MILRPYQREAVDAADKAQRRRDAVKRHRERHPDRVKARVQKWKAENAEKVREYNLSYYAANAERLRANRRAVYAVDPKSDKASHAAWAKANPDKNRERCSKRRAKKLNAPGHYTVADIQDLLKVQKGRCACCHKKLNRYHVDHIKPISRGGSNDRRNLQILCPSCNTRKKDKDPIIFAQELGLLL